MNWRASSKVGTPAVAPTALMFIAATAQANAAHDFMSQPLQHAGEEPRDERITRPRCVHDLRAKRGRKEPGLGAVLHVTALLSQLDDHRAHALFLEERGDVLGHIGPRDLLRLVDARHEEAQVRQARLDDREPSARRVPGHVHRGELAPRPRLREEPRRAFSIEPRQEIGASDVNDRCRVDLGQIQVGEGEEVVCSSVIEESPVPARVDQNEARARARIFRAAQSSCIDAGAGRSPGEDTRRAGRRRSARRRRPMPRASAGPGPRSCSPRRS